MSKKSERDIEIYEDIATLKESSKNQSAKLDRLIKLIEGNGKPGLLQDMEDYRRDVSQRLVEHEQKFVEIKVSNNAVKNTIIVIGTLLSLIVTFTYLF